MKEDPNPYRGVSTYFDKVLVRELYAILWEHGDLGPGGYSMNEEALADELDLALEQLPKLRDTVDRVGAQRGIVRHGAVYTVNLAPAEATAALVIITPFTGGSSSSAGLSSNALPSGAPAVRGVDIAGVKELAPTAGVRFCQPGSSFKLGDTLQLRREAGADALHVETRDGVASLKEGETAFFECVAAPPPEQGFRWRRAATRPNGQLIARFLLDGRAVFVFERPA